MVLISSVTSAICHLPSAICHLLSGLLLHHFDSPIEHLAGETVDGDVHPVMLFAFNNEIILQTGGIGLVVTRLRDQVDHQVPCPRLNRFTKSPSYGLALRLGTVASKSRCFVLAIKVAKPALFTRGLLIVDNVKLVATLFAVGESRGDGDGDGEANSPRRVFSSDRACKHTSKRRSLSRIQTNNPSAHARRIAVIVRCEEIEQTRVRAASRRKAKRSKRLVAEGVTHLADTAEGSVHHHWSPVISDTNSLSKWYRFVVRISTVTSSRVIAQCRRVWGIKRRDRSGSGSCSRSWRGTSRRSWRGSRSGVGVAADPSVIAGGVAYWLGQIEANNARRAQLASRVRQVNYANLAVVSHASGVSPWRTSVTA